MNMLKIVSLCMIGVIALCSACTYSPENDEWVDWQDLEFHGFAQNPSAFIQIQAYHKRDAEWRTVRVVQSNINATHFGGDTLYSWNAQMDFTAVAEWTCYWGDAPSNCHIPPGAAFAKFRFKELGSDLSFLTSFDEDGLNCVVDEVNNGSTWIVAGAVCAGEDSPVLTLRVLT